MLNEPFAWLWILLGMLSGAAIGMRFLDERFLGGYASQARRLIRLGHISFFGLGILNLLFVHSAEKLTLPPLLLSTASWGFIVGGIAMPVCCALCAFRPRLHPLFAVPVLSLAAATVITLYGLVQP
jgi:hypothetical protein